MVLRKHALLTTLVIVFSALLYMLWHISRARAPNVSRTRYLPISFAIHERYVLPPTSECVSTKNQSLATVIPGNKSTYIFADEAAYYADYRRSFYALTMKKGGWDCFRHYEILANGCVPFFLGIDDIPPLTMHTFPKELVQQAMRLPGVPTEESVKTSLTSTAPYTAESFQIDFSVFNETAYCELRQQLLQHAREHLTTRALGQYVVEQIRSLRPSVSVYRPRVLLITEPSVEYQSGFLYIGLVEKLGNALSTYPRRKAIVHADRRNDTNAYGRGFGFQGLLPTTGLHTDHAEAEADHAYRAIMEYRLQNGAFDAIIVTNGGNEYCKVDSYQAVFDAEHRATSLRAIIRQYRARHPESVLMFVDGSDLGGCHTTDLPNVDAHFVRETANAVSGPLMLRT
eukprot:gene18304-21825_t